MSDLPHQFRLADSSSANEVYSALCSHFHTRKERAGSLTVTYYDSFDWRLYLGGGVLRKEVEGRERRLVWASLEETPRETVRFTGAMPRFSDDVPPGLMRESLAPLLEMRALLPQVEVQSKIRLLRVLDAEEKTVLRVVFEENACRAPGRGEFAALVGRVRCLPVRGYAKHLQRVKQFLGDRLQLPPATDSLLQQALAAIGRRPADYTSKLSFDFDPEMPAAQAARQIHLHLLNTVEANLAGARADLDSEFLHDLRVAVRRTRSALTQIKGVFAEQDIERFKAELAWVGQITGPTRDMDVYLLDFDKYRHILRPQFRQDLGPLKDFLVAHQKSEHAAMVRKINSARFRGLLAEWRRFLEAPQQEQVEAPPKAALPLRKVARKRIYSIYKRVMAEGSAITQESPAEDLHELRKSCKKLRYLIEFFRSIYPNKDVAELIKGIKTLLDNLGEFQDLQVQAFKLREFAHQIFSEGNVPADTLLAMGMLVDELLNHQQEARAQFADRFAAFAGSGQREIFMRLFAPNKVEKSA